MSRFSPNPLRFFISVFVFFFLCGFSSGPFTDIETAIIEKDYPKAEALSRDLIARPPKTQDFHLAHYYLGLSQMGEEKYDEARETFNFLITQKPDEPLLDKAYLGVIDSYLLTGDYANALTVSEALLTSNSKSEFLSLIYLKLARANLKLARWEVARDYLNKIVKEFPQSLEFHLAKQLLEEQHYFTVQVGSFLDSAKAEHLADQLKEKGEYAYILQTTDHQGRQFYRVRIGQFSDLQQAQSIEQKLSSLGYPTHIYP